MKAYCDTTVANPNPDKDFSHNHLYLNFKRFIDISREQMPTDMTHYLIMDMDQSVNGKFDVIKSYRDQGVKVVLMVFDPAAFPRVDNMVNAGLVDKLVLFDKQFEGRFSVRTYITDYFFNEGLFVDKTTEGEGVCVFGHLECGRVNDFNLPRVDTFPHIQGFRDLYKEVQKYNGVAVYDTGLSEGRDRVVHYNKAKAVESLMCGVNAYCKPGIRTKRFDKYILKYDQIKEPLRVDFDRKEIVELNELTILELIHECEIT